MISAEKIAGLVVESLREKADPSRKALSDWYFPTSMKVIGLSSAGLKKVAAETRKIVKQESLPGDRLKELLLILSRNGVFECQQVAYEIINRNFRLIASLTKEETEAMALYMDNWVSTDSFSTRVAGPAWRLGVLSDSDIDRWASSADRWWRRNALVATVGLNLRSQGGLGDTERTLAICSKLVDDRDDMVVKAQSWALRELSKHDAASVEEFMKSMGDRIASRARREVTRKLLTGRKNG